MKKAMIYRNAVIKDIPAISELQKKYHIATISEEDKPDGFVTTLFTEEQFKELIEKEDGIAIACDGDKIAAYAMAASWEYWSKWPIFQYMIEDLQNIEYMGQILSVKNSYQYGPICIDKDYRGTEVLPMIFDFSRMQMKNKGLRKNAVQGSFHARAFPLFPGEPGRHQIFQNKGFSDSVIVRIIFCKHLVQLTPVHLYKAFFINAGKGKTGSLYIEYIPLFCRSIPASCEHQFLIGAVFV